MSIETDFLEAIRAAGLDYAGDIIANGDIQRIKVNGDRNSSTWYVLHPDHPAAGAFGDYKRDIKENWCAVGSESLTEEERAERDQKWKVQREARQALEAHHAAAAAQRAQAILDANPPATDDHPYLVAKRVKAYPGLKVGDWPKGRRIIQNCLLIPLRRLDGSLTTLEAIFPTIDPEIGRNKDLLYRGKKPGAMFIIGDLSTSRVILIAEGYATAASLHEATSYATVMAIDAGNLQPVMNALAALYPDKPRLICADNDRHTDDNPGLAKARAAARASHSLPPAIPEFRQDEEGSDFNDLMRLHGKDAVQSVIESALSFKKTNGFSREGVYKQSAQSALSAQSISYSFVGLHRVCTDQHQSAPPFDLVVPNLTAGNEAVIESDAAKELADALRGRLAFCRESLTWHGFTGTHWQPLNSAVADELVIKLLYAGTADCGFKANYATAVVNLLRKGMLPLPDTAVTNDQLIPFTNGLLNPITHKLTDPTPDNALTWCLPYAYDSVADCPTIKAWLRKALDEDETRVEFMRAWFAALLTARADLQKFLHLLGAGQSGKGTAIRLMSALIGAHNTMPTDLRNLEQSRFETASLYGKRLVAITDTSRYGGSVDVLKALTGQDPLRLERKHKDPGSFTFDGLVVIASNEPLQFTDYTGAVERRRLTVCFDRVASDEERDLWDSEGGESVVLHQEIPGLVNWCLELTRQEVTRLIRTERPASVIKANLNALRASNPIADWFMENTYPDPDAKTQIGVSDERQRNGGTVFEFAESRLYPNYLTWCLERRRSSIALQRFSVHIIDVAKVLKVEAQKHRDKTYNTHIQGLRLREPYEDPFDWHELTLRRPVQTGADSAQTQAVDCADKADCADQTQIISYRETVKRQETSQSPIAQRIHDALASRPSGYSTDELVKLIGNGRGGSPAMIEAELMTLVKAGAVSKANGKWTINR